MKESKQISNDSFEYKNTTYVLNYNGNNRWSAVIQNGHKTRDRNDIFKVHRDAQRYIDGKTKEI